MPTYIFKNKKTEEVFEIQMRISELDIYKAENPQFSQLPTAPNFRLNELDGTRLTLKQEIRKT